MPEPLASFQRTQYAFAAAIRGLEPDESLQDIPPERLNLYRELIYHNLERFIAGGFPVLHELLDAARWHALIKDFVLHHCSKTPYFRNIAEEFLDYLNNERGDREDDPPFLLELAHYEWVELAISVEEADPPPESPAALATPLEVRPFLARTAWPLVYRYPVQRIGRDYQPDEPPQEATFLAVYRDRGDQVHFLELNAVTYRLLGMIQENCRLPAHEYLDRIGAELGYAEPCALRIHGAELLSDLMRRGLIGAS